MSPFSDMTRDTEFDDLIWKALADKTRRKILDILAESPQTTGEIVARFEGLSRTNVMKHMDVLVKANLVMIRRDGRSRWNHLNPAPIQAVCDRWISKHVQGIASSMARLKNLVESEPKQDQKSDLQDEAKVDSATVKTKKTAGSKRASKSSKKRK